MDTINETEPVGGEDVSSSQDTSAVDTQSVEVEEVVDGDNQTETEKALLAGKYKSPEELEKAYKELESKLGERNENSELTKMLEEQTGMTAGEIRNYIAQQNEQKLQQQYQSNPAPYLASKIQQLESKIALQAEEKELEKFLETNPEYAPHKEDIMDMGLNFKRDMSYEEIAKKYFGAARAQGQQDAYKKIDTKKQTQATGVSQAPAKGKVTMEDLAQMSSKDMEAVLPWADISNRV